MATGESKIKFTVEGITQLHQHFQSILNDSKALTEEWQKQGTSIVQSLRDQIELLKKRNSVAQPSSLTPGASATGLPGGGAGNFQDIENALETIVSDGVLIHQSSLKELAALLSSASPSTAGKPSGQGGQSTKPENVSDGTEESQRDRFLKNLAMSALIRPIQSKDPFQAGIGLAENAGTSLMALGGKAGWAGAALATVAAIIGARYNAVAEVAPTAAQASRLLGGEWSSYVPADRRIADTYGLQRNDVLQRQMALGRALGTSRVSRAGSSEFETALLWEATTSLSGGDIEAYARSIRGSREGTLGRGMSSYFDMLNRSGVTRDKIFTQMSEYLGQLVSLNKEQLDKWGSSDTNLSTALYSMVAKVLPRTAENNPELIGRLAQNLYSGMSTASSRQIEALQYMTASRVMGNRGGWYQARMMREDPFGQMESLSPEERERRQQYARELMRQYRGVAGSTEGFAYLLEKQFGFTANQSYAFAKQYDKGEFDFSKFQDEARKVSDTSKKEDELRQRLPNTVDDISKLLASWEGVKLGKNVDDIREAVQSISKLLNGRSEQPQSPVLVDHSSLADEIQNQEAANGLGRLWNWFQAATIRSAPYMK